MRRNPKLSSSRQKSREDPSEEEPTKALESVTNTRSCEDQSPKDWSAVDSLSNTDKGHRPSPLCDVSRTFWIVAFHGILENGGGKVLRSHSHISLFSNKETGHECQVLSEISQPQPDSYLSRMSSLNVLVGEPGRKGVQRAATCSRRGKLHSMRSHEAEAAPRVGAETVAHLS